MCVCWEGVCGVTHRCVIQCDPVLTNPPVIGVKGLPLMGMTSGEGGAVPIRWGEPQWFNSTSMMMGNPNLMGVGLLYTSHSHSKLNFQKSNFVN